MLEIKKKEKKKMKGKTVMVRKICERQKYEYVQLNQSANQDR